MKKTVLRLMAALLLCAAFCGALLGCSPKLQDTYEYTTTYSGKLASSLTLAFSGREVEVTLTHYKEMGDPNTKETISAVAEYRIEEEETVNEKGEKVKSAKILFIFPEDASVRITDGVYHWIGSGEWLTFENRTTTLLINGKRFWRQDQAD